MPKFYKQNKKRIDPRYFLNEKMEDQEPQTESRSKTQKRIASKKEKVDKSSSSYKKGYKDGLDGNPRDQRTHVRSDPNYIQGMKDGKKDADGNETGSEG